MTDRRFNGWRVVMHRHLVSNTVAPASPPPVPASGPTDPVVGRFLLASAPSCPAPGLQHDRNDDVSAVNWDRTK